MAGLTLGSHVTTLEVLLHPGADFNTTITNTDDDWPNTATIELRFTDGPTWTAAITGTDAVFAEDKADVDALIATTTVRRVSLWYIDGDADLCWATGTVQVA